MKKTKIIIPALGLLLLSTAASVSGTVAWFAMNASVQANSLQITAKSESVFLLIGTSSDLATVKSGKATSVNLSAANASVFPSAHDSITNTAAATATDVSNLKQYALKSATSTKISIDEYNALPAGPVEGDANDKTDYQAENANGTNWYYQIADEVDNYASTKQKNYLATLDTNYIIHQTVYVTLADGSTDSTGLKVKNAHLAITNVKDGGVSETMDPVRVLVTSSTAAVEFGGEGAAFDTANSTVLASSVTSAALVQIDIFVYYDGNDEDVFTNNIANLEGATVDLTFDVNRVQ